MTVAPLYYEAKFDPVFSLDCAGLGSGERNGSNFSVCYHLATLIGGPDVQYDP